MKKKDVMILAYHPDQEVGHISYFDDRDVVGDSRWKILGKLYGTLEEANEELERRIQLYKNRKYSKLGIKLEFVHKPSSSHKSD